MKFFTLAEIALLFEVSISTVKRWVDEEKLITEAIPGGTRRRATAASIRQFARHYGPGHLAAFGGILAVGMFDKPIPDGVTLATGLVDCGRCLEQSFPAVVLVSFADLRKIDFPSELRAAGFDGLVACVVNDDETIPAADLQSMGWQMVCRASEDYWTAAVNLGKNAEQWWKQKEVALC